MRALLLLLLFPTFAFAQAGGPPFIPVNMLKVAASPVSNTVSAVGALNAEDSVVMRPEIAGRIEKLLFSEGQPVKKGAVLAFILTLPITVVTLGLFLLVLNAGMVGLVAWLVPGFEISGFWTAMGAALIVSLLSWAASSAIGTNGRIEIFRSTR